MIIHESSQIKLGAALSLGTKALTIFQLLFISFLLSPRDIGIFASALIIVTTAEALLHGSYNQALIRKRYVSHKDLNTYFSIMVGRGTLISLFCIILSLFIDRILPNYSAQQELLVLSVIPIMLGLQNPNLIHLQRQKKIFYFLIPNQTGVTVNLFVSLTLAWQGYGSWSLVYGLVCQNITSLVVSYLVTNSAFGFALGKWQKKYIFSFGNYIIAAHIFKFLSLNAPIIVLIYLGNFEFLGLFFLISKFMDPLVKEIIKFSQHIILPLISQYKRSQKKLHDIYIDVNVIMLTASIAIYLPILCFSAEIEKYILPARWNGSGDIIFILALFGMVQLFGTQPEFIKIIGKTKTIFSYSLIRLAVVICLLIHFGADLRAAEVALTRLVPAALLLFFGVYLVLTLLKMSASKFLITLIPVGLVIPITTIFILQISTYISSQTGFIIIFIGTTLLNLLLLFASDKFFNSKRVAKLLGSFFSKPKSQQI